MKFEDYPLRVPSVKKVESKIKVLLEDFNNSKTSEEAYKVVKKFFKFGDSIESDSTVISIRNSIDTTDPVYEKAMNKIDEIGPILSSYYQEFDKAVNNSKFKDELEKKIGKHYFDAFEASLKTFDAKIIDECVEENKLVTQYEKIMSSAKIDFNGEVLNMSQLGKYLSYQDRDIRIKAAKAYYGFIEEHDQEFGEIYDKLVHVRDKMAKKMGFKNFVDFGYLRLGRLDYNSTMVANYRKQIQESVVPVVAKLRKRQMKRLGISRPIFADYNLEYTSGNAKPCGDSKYLVAEATKMYHDMSVESGQFFDFMVDNHLMDLDAKAGKRGGGYMTYMAKYKSPFIFANSNGTSQDVDTLTHEVGHAFQGYLGSKINIPLYRMPTLESCEIDSMSMEFFAYPYMKGFFGEQDEKYRFSHLDGAISFLPYGVEVDDFQHWVYEHVDATHEERCAYWAKIDKIYRPWMNYKGFPYLESGHMWIRQSHIYSVAFYYIDYTLAQVLALQFKCEMDKNKEKAWKKYIKLLKMGGKYPFLTLLEKAHLRNPFIDGNVKKVIKPQVKILNSIDDRKF